MQRYPCVEQMVALAEADQFLEAMPLGNARAPAARDSYVERFALTLVIPKKPDKMAKNGRGTAVLEDLLKTRKPADPHPLGDLAGFRKQLDDCKPAPRSGWSSNARAGDVMSMPPNEVRGVHGRPGHMVPGI